MKLKILNRILLATLAIALFSCLIPSAYAQCETAPSITRAVAAESDDQIVILFDFGTDWTDTQSALVTNVQKPASWTVFSPTLLQKAKAATDRTEKAGLYDQATPTIRQVVISGSRGVKIQLTTALIKSEKYMVNIADDSGVIPPKCVGAALAIKVVAPPTGQTQAVVPQTKTVLAPVEKRDDAEIYIEGLAEGAKKSKTTYTVDATISKKLPFNSDDPEYFWQPFFNIKASTSKDADPNSLNFGVKFENPTGILRDNFLQVKRLYFTEAAKFEADRDFKYVNFVGDFRLRLVSKILNRQHFNIVPFFGIEVGKNLKSPVPDASGIAIARPLFGATFYSKLYKWGTDKYDKVLSFETQYIRRFPLTREVAIDDDDAGMPFGVHISKAPRDYVKSSLTYDFARNFGFKVNYEYGSLPPLFKLVNHKFSIGLVFKGVFKKE